MEDIVIVSAARTAVGKFGGSLAGIAATELGALVIKEVIARANLTADQVGEAIMGQVLAAGAGQNPARQAWLKSGGAKETPALTINAVHTAARIRKPIFRGVRSAPIDFMQKTKRGNQQAVATSV